MEVIPIAAKSMSVKHLKNLQAAHYLIAGGIRPINVEAVTRIKKRYLTALWQSMHGFPAKGQTPIHSYTYLRPYKAAREAVALVEILAAYGKEQDIHDINMFVLAYQRYGELSPWATEINMEKAFYIWRDYRRNLLSLKYCTSCKAVYLHSTHHDAGDTLRGCIFCRLMTRCRLPEKFSRSD